VAFAIITIFLPVLVGAIDAADAYWAVRHDPTWESRWRALDPAESSWLAVIATSRDWRATLTDPEEIRLANGRRSQESRRRVVFDLAALPVFAAAGVLVLAGVLGEGALLFVFLAFGLARTVWIYRREREIKKELKIQRELAAATYA
jgi:Flp pilus assembly protein TadB